MDLSLLNVGAVAVLGLLGVGLYGLLVSRNLIKVIIALQLLGKAAVLGLLVAGKASGQMNLSQSLAITVIVADTIVAVVGMALAIQVRRQLKTLDVRELARLKG
ncbi:MAG: NADH-quinone oxidoreductase subunit K [Chloroflexi bacterium]|nr:NADH-quinone oxidoreductase subunit K [Chloroflexota bacterium]